jgi:hypothetical protein
MKSSKLRADKGLLIGTPNSFLITVVAAQGGGRGSHFKKSIGCDRLAATRTFSQRKILSGWCGFSEKSARMVGSESALWLEGAVDEAKAAWDHADR